MKTTWPPSASISDSKLSTPTLKISNYKSGIPPGSKGSEPSPTLTTKVPLILIQALMLSFWFTMLPTWKLFKVLKTFGWMKSKVMLIQEPNWSLLVLLFLFRKQGRHDWIQGRIKRESLSIRKAKRDDIFRDISKNCVTRKRILHDSYIITGKVAVKDKREKETVAEKQHKFRQPFPTKQGTRRMLRLLTYCWL
jgi:hypothetical protein